MRFIDRLKIIRYNLFAVVVCFAIILTAPLQFLDFIILGKNRILKFLESYVFRTLFKINDLKVKQQLVHTKTDGVTEIPLGLDGHQYSRIPLVVDELPSTNL